MSMEAREIGIVTFAPFLQVSLSKTAHSPVLDCQLD
jgi:hypothetical protein